MSAAKHTPGPWRWELNESSKGLHLVGGIPMFDLTIMDFTRWGMHSATVRLRDTAHDGMNIMHKLHERRDWIAPFYGRKHHAEWCANVLHPDMRLIATAPQMLEALRAARKELHSCQAVIHLRGGFDPAYVRDAQVALKTIDDAIAKATGAQP